MTASQACQHCSRTLFLSAGPNCRARQTHQVFRCCMGPCHWSAGAKEGIVLEITEELVYRLLLAQTPR